MNIRILSSRISPIRIALATLFGAVVAANAQSFTGEFSAVNMGSGNSDTLVGLNANKSFLHAYNLGEAVNVAVNGVTFTGVAGANPTVASVFSTTGLPSLFGGGGTNPAGQLGLLTNKFVYGSNVAPNTGTEAVTLSNLTIGNTYVYTIYTRSWEAAGARVQNMSATGASTTPGGFAFDEDMGATGQGNLVMLRYTFQATSTTQVITAAPANTANTLHMTAFTTENVFNNSWASGADWTTATWGSPGVPNSAGSNANFAAQGAPTSINLNANVTTGHVQFDGANAWTVSGTNTLNLQADVGGVSTISAKSGSHTISAPITLANNLMKLGAGNVTLSGAIGGSGVRSIHNTAGTLTLGNTANSFTGELIMAGNGIVNVASLSDYGVPSAIGARTLAQENTSTTGVGLHFQGGTLQYTGSTPQSTNRHIRLFTGNNTIDASGSNPAATLSFTQSGTNVNLFDTGGARTLVLTGTNTGNNLFALQLINQGGSATSVTKTGTGTWDLSSAASTYTGTTTVQQGTLNLSGARTAAAGAITVGNTTGQSGVLNIQNGNFSVGTVTVANGDSTVIGTVNQTGGTITLTGTQAIVGNGSGGKGTYNLSAGTLNGTAAGNRGIILGTNTGSQGTFNLTGTGNLNLTGANLQVGRTEAGAATGVTGVFNQTGGTATVGTLGVGGLDAVNNASNSGTMNFTGGTFVATSINGFAGGNNSVAAINIGGTSQVTLPAFPTVRGAGATSSVTFDGGTLKAGGSSATYMQNLTAAQIKNGGLKFDSNGFDVTVNQPLTDFAGNTGTLTKSGNGIMTLSGASTFTGATTVNGGTLRVNGSLGVAPVTVAAGGTLGGTGTINSGIIAAANGRIAPGVGVGTLTAGTVTLAAGSLLDFEFNGVANDVINVSSAGGLTINGGAFKVYAENTVTPFGTNGTYTLIDYNTSYSGTTTNLSLLNPALGKFYTIADDSGATAITMTISDSTSSEWNGGAADGAWTTSGNWTAGSPDGVGVVAKFGTIPTSATAVAVSGPKTLGGIIFDNANAYTINGGAGDAITLSNGIASAAIGVTSGSHTIAAPLVLNANLDSQPATGTQVTFAGPISGAKPFVQNGLGTSVLSGANSYTTTQVNLGTLQVGAGGTSGTLGSGDATIAAGATLAFNRSDDISVATNIGGAGTVSKLGNNTVTFTGANTFATLSVSAGTATIAGTNTFGLLNVTGGFAQVGSATGVPTTATVNVGALGTFDVNEVNTTVAGITGTGLITDNGFNPGQTTLTINNAANVTFSGRIEDGFDRTVAFVKTGAGTLTIDGTAINSHTGGTTVANGTLALARTSGTALSGAITIGDGVGADVLQLNAPDQIDNASVLSFTSGGAGNSAFFRINGNNETVRGITTTVANAAVIENNSPVAASTATLTVDTAGSSFTYDGIIRNATAGTAIMAITKAGAGTLTLKNTALVGTTSYTGATTVTGGKLVLENFASFVSPLVLSSTDADAVTFAQNSVDLAYAGVITGTGGITKTGNNTLTLSGVNTQTGPTTINAGTLGIGNNAAFGTGTIVMNGGIIRASGAARSMANPVTVNGSFTLGRLTDLTGAITLNADATITANNFDGPANGNSILGPISGNYRLTLAEGAQGIGSGALVMNGINTNSFGTVVSSGRVTVSASGALSVGTLTVNGGALNLNNAVQNVSKFEGTGGTITLGTGNTLAIFQSESTGDTTYAGTITGAGGIAKAGTDTSLTLSGTNTFTGGAVINGGGLIITGSLSGSVQINTGGTLGGPGSVGAVVSTGGELAPGLSFSPGSLTAASLALDSASALSFQLASSGVVGSGVNDLFSVGGALTLDGTLYVEELSGFSIGSYRIANYSGVLTDNGLELDSFFAANYPGSYVDVATTGEVNLVVVPEPGAAALLLGGMGILFGARRRRTSSR